MSSIENISSSEMQEFDQNQARFGRFFPSSRSFILFILVVLIMAGLTAGILSGRKEMPPIGVLPTLTPIPETSKMIVYGVWLDNQSIIKGYDINLKKEYLIAHLPINIKKVTVLSETELLYIGNTNDKDHGRNLSIYNLSTKQSNIIYQSDTGFGIDDYVISKDKRYISTWEVSFSKDSTVLLGGKSRVYSVDRYEILKQSMKQVQDMVQNDGLVIKNLIYDELSKEDNPVHYPRAITQNGEIFLDTFLPNSGAGWSYGMSASNLQGSQKQNLDNMRNGTYGTQPSISKDERYLVFSGYDKTDGAEEENGFRKALLRPNTIELLDTQTKERRRLKNVPSTNKYPFSYFDQETGDIVLTSISQNTETEIFLYKISSSILRKINIEGDIFVGSFSNSKILMGLSGTSVSSIGNLGDGYNAPFTSFSILNIFDGEKTAIKLTNNYVQFLSLVNSNYLTNITELKTDSDKTLQLQTFNFKPSLAPKREEQQTEPINPDEGSPFCYQLIERQCGALTRDNLNSNEKIDRYLNCKARIWKQAGKVCLDSPLYLYGKAGTSVNIKVKTYVYSSDPLYDEKTGYNVTLLENGKMKVNGKVYDRINYDYLSQKVSPPSNGIITSKEELSETLKYFAQNLGLNQKETDDLVNFGNKNIKSPFIFISFYDQKTSEQILPLELTPKPDTYINIVFYFKEYQQRPSIKPQNPIFKSPPQRTGLTAVEVSEVVDKESKK